MLADEPEWGGELGVVGFGTWTGVSELAKQGGRREEACRYSGSCWAAETNACSLASVPYFRTVSTTPPTSRPADESMRSGLRNLRAPNFWLNHAAARQSRASQERA